MADRQDRQRAAGAIIRYLKRTAAAAAHIAVRLSSGETLDLLEHVDCGGESAGIGIAAIIYRMRKRRAGGNRRSLEIAGDEANQHHSSNSRLSINTDDSRHVPDRAIKRVHRVNTGYCREDSQR